MRKLSEAEINKILEEHKLFLNPDCNEPYIVNLCIPEEAERVSAAGKETEGWSYQNHNLVYRPEEPVEVPDFDECRWNECTSGICFFMSSEEAVRC